MRHLFNSAVQNTYYYLATRPVRGVCPNYRRRDVLNLRCYQLYERGFYTDRLADRVTAELVCSACAHIVVRQGETEGLGWRIAVSSKALRRARSELRKAGATPLGAGRRRRTYQDGHARTTNVYRTIV